jgi:regulator of protease activity HflC (stomatin/prohibitin superfamily)
MRLLQELLGSLGKLFKWWFVVVPWEQALRIRAGKHVTKLGAGIHMRIPFLDRLYVQSTRMRWVELPEQTLSTADGKVISLQGMLGYSIVNLEKLYRTLHHANATLQGEAMSLIARYIHGHLMEECKPVILEDFLSGSLKLDKYGIGNTQLSITDFAVAKTYRLITSSDRYLAGDSLTTHREHTPGEPY